MQQHSKLVLGFTAIVLSGTLAFGAVASAAGSGVAAGAAATATAGRS